MSTRRTRYTSVKEIEAGDMLEVEVIRYGHWEADIYHVASVERDAETTRVTMTDGTVRTFGNSGRVLVTRSV